MAANLAIHRLSARTPARAETVAARLALQALGADLEDALPRGLPPQSLLWLRRLQLQAPEAALLRPAPVAWRREWIAAGREQLDAALAQAARPALGPVPGSAPAVLFADAAEMLACLALAAQGGQVDRWWWRGLLGRAWPQWQTAWAARPEAQAGAQRLLARLGQGGIAAGGMLPLPAARPPAVAEVPRLAVAGGARARPAPLAVARMAVAPPVLQPDEVGRVPSPPASSARPLATPLPPGVAPVADMPAAVACASSPGREQPVSPVAAMPALVDTQTPAPAARQIAVPADDGALRSPPATAAPVAAPHEARAVAAGARRQRELPVPSAAPTSDGRPPAIEAAPVAPSHATAPVLHISQPMPAPPAAAMARARTPPDPSPPPRRPRAVAAVPASARLDPSEPAVSSTAAWPWPQAVLSRQAPLLFIVNALLEDGLYPDFTRPRDPGLPVPLWALLAALADAWRLPADGLLVALQQRCPDWAAPEAMPAAPGASAGPWAEWLPAYARSLRRRLCRRLGLRPAAWPQALTLAQPARLWLSEAEWVAEFDLNAHDVAWRLAGLDRDPGWLPSAGCSLRFVFT